eukprot:TRINITY_DN24459_c0_g1_i2.p1 TRINITY_DN24459_c0_g1~~TRINITY_DN24459_c0_g1_i2.p1  ORF type:complete len:327 (+),score=98.70 TRINITY_DN24459_c0_g1_i2:24-1004(+)
MWSLFPLVITLAVGVVGDDGVAQYQFSYRVKDDTTGQDFGQEEERQGYNTGGEYQVNLPDGRRQIVTYSVADPDSGYVADVSYTGEAKYEQRLEQPQRPTYTPEVQPPALPPIRNKPSLPRAEKALRPVRPKAPSAEEVRFISRPTKIVPTIIKVSPVTKSAPKAPQFLSRPTKIVPTINKKILTTKSATRLSPRPTILPKFISRPTKIIPTSRRVTQAVKSVPKAPKVDNSRRPKKISEKLQTVPRKSSLKVASTNSPTVQKPISAMKSKTSTTTTAAPPPVYISTKTPKLTYKDKYHTAESQVLYSLFREDINGKDMKPPPKKP